jgi:hypothetical protein
MISELRYLGTSKWPSRGREAENGGVYKNGNHLTAAAPGDAGESHMT